MERVFQDYPCACGNVLYDAVMNMLCWRCRACGAILSEEDRVSRATRRFDDYLTRLEAPKEGG